MCNQKNNNNHWEQIIINEIPLTQAKGVYISASKFLQPAKVHYFKQ